MHLTADLVTRTNLTPQFLAGAKLFADRAQAMHPSLHVDVAEGEKVLYRAYVISAVTQACAAIESAAVDVLSHGRASFLGSNEPRNAADVQRLAPVADLVEREGVLLRWARIHRLLGVEPLDPGRRPAQDASLLVELRNELVHYQGRVEGRTKSASLTVRLRDLRFALPACLVVVGQMDFFPHQALVADCVSWAVDTAARFIDAAFDRLGVRSVLDHFRTGDMPLPPRTP